MKSNRSWTKQPLVWFFISYVIFQLILFVMRNDDQVFWTMITGMMLLSSFSYIFYQRHIASKRIMISIATGIAASILIVVIYFLMMQMFTQLHVFSILKTFVKIGIYYKLQLIVSLVVLIPLHELYFRSVLQNELMERTNYLISILVTALLSTALFIWAINSVLLLFIFIIQFILASSYVYTRRLITPITGQILAVVMMILLFAQ